MGRREVLGALNLLHGWKRSFFPIILLCIANFKCTDYTKTNKIHRIGKHEVR